MTNPADKLSLLMATPNEEPVSQYKGVVQQTDDSKAYVLIDGGTAVWCDTMDVKALVGDRVRVEVRKHKGTLVANYTHPVTDDAVANAADEKATEALGKVETLEVDALKADSAVIRNLQADTAKVHDLTADQLSAATAYVGELTAGEVTAQSIIADKAKLAQVDTDQLHADHAVIETLDSTYASIDNLNAATARIGNIEADYLVAADMTAEQARVGQLIAGKADVADLTAANARIDTLESTKADISVLESDYITADAIDATYLHADMSNADVAWIQNGVIKDAAISDAQIIGVSANKLTAGTIDASNINVTNLRADNLKVTRINGQPVIGGYALVDPSSSGYSSKNPKAQGWYELSGSSYVATNDTSVVSGKNYYSTSDYAELYDQDAIDSMVDSLNNRIDAQIETWTTDAVPTLNNYPASSWTTSDARAEHVGDICYVMNAGNDYDGYTYRFAYDNSTSSYKWVLIKDNQVTAALGRISDLETFESETSTWIDETDEGLRTIRSNHTALAGRVDKVVKSSVQLWYTKANETAPSAPNSVVTSTSTSGNGWRTVVPTYNSSYPFYFYCWQYQYEDGTYDWSAVVYDRATSESEERARTGVTNAASAQTTANANIKSSVQLWFTKANDTAPSKPSGTNPITVSDASKRNQWNLVVPTYSDSYPYYFYCYQQQKGDNTYQWTDVVYDEATSTAMKKAQEALPSSTFATFEQTTFKEVVDDVDEQSTKITTLTTITENNGLTETTNISNTVNQVSQTASGNSAKLSNITETIGANADGTNPSTKSVIARTSAVEQTLEGFQTTVTNVQRTAEEANDRGVAYSGTSSTGASTADKVAACTNFELVAGATVTVRFSAANTSTGAITLNVNNTGKRTVYVNGAATSSSNQLLWGASANVTFTYDGSYWRIVSEPRPWVGSCSVAAGTAAKTATINEVVICKGTSMTLNMTYSNTSTSATLNVTSTGAKNIYYGTTSTRPTTENGYGWTDASTQTFVFDGAYWRIGDTSALAGLATANGILSSHTTQIAQNAQNIEMKANSSEVYTKTQTDGLITSEVEARNAAIKVSADSITQSVSENYTTKTEFDNESALRKGTYATCTTAAATAAKVATITPAVTGYALYAGATVTVRFQYGNTVANLTLNVNSTGAKEVVVNGTADPLAKHVKWGAYATCTFVYDGTYWRFAGSDQEVVRVSTAETAIEQNASDITLRATKTEVQQVRPAYATSGTAVGTAAKVATIDPAVTGYVLYKGASVAVTFSTANTAATPTLNVNSTGAKQIRSYTGAALSEAEYKWAAGSTIDLVYDGTYWRMQDGGSVKRVASAEASIRVNAESIESKVSKDGVISSINQSAETVKIQASKVEIDGTAIFSAISSDVDDAITDKGYATTSQAQGYATTAENNAKNDTTNKLKSYSTTAQANNLYDAKGAAQTVQNNLDNLEIGGRNLFRNSATLAAGSISGGGGTFSTGSDASLPSGQYVQLTSTNDATNGPHFSDTSALGNYNSRMIEGETYTASAWIYHSAGGTISSFGPERAVNATYSSLVIPAAKWTKVWKTFTYSTTTTYKSCTCYFANTKIKNGAYIRISSWMLEKGNKDGDWTPASEDLQSNAVKRTQRIWYRKSAEGAPATPGTASSNWVVKADDGSNAWTKMHVSITETEKFIYTCEQYEMGDGTVGYTSVLLDNTITVIDGGNIITGSVTAIQIAAGTITGNEIAGGTITSDNIEAGAISADRLDANALTVGNIAGLEDQLETITNGISSLSNSTQWVHFQDSVGTVFGEAGSANNVTVKADGVYFNTEGGEAARASAGIFYSNEMQANDSISTPILKMGNWALMQSGTTFSIEYLG